MQRLRIVQRRGNTFVGQFRSQCVAIFDEYRRAPEVTKKRIYLETMNTILPQITKKIVVDDELKGIIPLLNLEPTTSSKGGDQ